MDSLIYSLYCAFAFAFAVRPLITCSRRAKDLITTHIDILHKTAEILIEKETIDGDEFLRLFEERGTELYLKS